MTFGQSAFTDGPRCRFPDEPPDKLADHLPTRSFDGFTSSFVSTRNVEYGAQRLGATEAVRLADDAASRLRGYGAGSSWIVQPYVARTCRVAGAETHG